MGTYKDKTTNSQIERQYGELIKNHNVKLNTFRGCFSLMFNAMHVIRCWKQNPVTSPQKSLTLMMITYVICVVNSIILINEFNISSSDETYQKFKSKIGYKLYTMVCPFVLLVLYEAMKALFLTRSNTSGMVKLEEER